VVASSAIAAMTLGAAAIFVTRKRK
jgi:hypothetical protein